MFSAKPHLLISDLFVNVRLISEMLYVVPKTLMYWFEGKHSTIQLVLLHDFV